MAEGLRSRPPFYTRKLEWSALQPHQARVIDLDEHPGWKPMLKTNGTGLPGFHSGWFRLRNRRKALLAMGAGHACCTCPLPKATT